MTRLAIAPVARADLQELRRHSKMAFGVARTLAYMAGLRSRFETVLSSPMLGRQEPDLGLGVRSIGYRSHRVYYRHVDDELIIVRVLHHARDVERAFTDPS